MRTWLRIKKINLNKDRLLRKFLNIEQPRIIHWYLQEALLKRHHNLESYNKMIFPNVEKGYDEPYIGIQYGRYLEWQNIQSEIDVEYELERFDNNRDEQTQYHRAVCDGSPCKSPIKQNNTGDLFNIETNTAQPDDTAIGAATAAVTTALDPTVFTAIKAVVGAKPNSTKTITAIPWMITLVGVTAVSPQQPIKNQRHWISILQWEFGAVS